MSDGGQRLILLDGVRGIAALAVLYYHLPRTVPGDFLFNRGYLMVDLFFLLSGFVLCLSAEPRLAAGMGAARFLRARIIRLWPMIAAGALVGSAVGYAILILSDGIFSLRASFWHGVQTLMALALLPSIIRTRSGALFPLNGPHWSLLFELGANAVHALVLWRLGNRSILALALLFAALLIASIKQVGLNNAGPFFADWYYAIPRLGFSYCAGILLARHWLSGRGRVSAPWLVALLLPLASICLAALLEVDRIVEDAALVTVVFPALLWVAACSTAPEAARPALTWLGAISYPLYAVHTPLLKLAATFFGTPTAAMAAALGAIALAAVLAAVFERHRHHRLAMAPVPG